MTVSNIDAIPSTEANLDTNRDDNIDWNTLEYFWPYENQLNESFLEHIFLLDFTLQNINKYKRTNVHQECNYLWFTRYSKILYREDDCSLLSDTRDEHYLYFVTGCPRKSPWKYISTKIVLPSNRQNLQSSHFRATEYALKNIRRKTDLLNAFLSIDVLYVDDIAQ